ncbi:MAG: hypothetical protein RR586_03195 [Cellulosilyticaceae bacterium]
MSKKELNQAIKEVKKRMAKYNEPEKSNKGLLIGLGIVVITVLVGLVLWLRSKNDEDIEEYYEYFDDEMEEELDDSDLYGTDEDSSDDVEYVQIKSFDLEDEAEEDEIE